MAATVYMVHVVAPPKHFLPLLMTWDGGWYLGIAKEGYPNVVPPGIGVVAQSRLVFFPGYPAAIKLLNRLTGLSHEVCAALISLFAGFIAVILLWHLARHFTDSGTATRAVALLSFFPAGYVLSMAYAEAFFIMFVAACLLALVHRRWFIAGLAAALAGATRLHGLALLLSCAWAAWVAIRDRREWKALIAPVLAPIGTAAWLGYQWAHTGSPFTWLDSQRRGWANDASAIEFFNQVKRLFSSAAGHDFTLWQGGFGLAFLAAGAFLYFRWRPAGELSLYSAGVVIPSMIGALLSPRYYMVVLPFYIAIARVVKGPAFAVLIGVSAMIMSMLFVVISLSPVTVP